MRRFLNEGNSNTFAPKKQLAKQNILADFEQLSNVVTFLAEDYECSEVLPIDTASSHLAGDSVCVLTSGPHLQWHQRGWRRCLMISHVGLLPKLSQSSDIKFFPPKQKSSGLRSLRFRTGFADCYEKGFWMKATPRNLQKKTFPNEYSS